MSPILKSRNIRGVVAAALFGTLSMMTAGCDQTTITQGGGGGSLGPPSNPPATTTTLTTSVASTVQGSQVTMTATVTPAPDPGSVTLNNISQGTTELKQTIAGVATFQPVLALGTNVFIASNDATGIPPASNSAPVSVTASAPGATCGLGLAAQTFTSGIVSQSGQTYASGQKDQSAICAANQGTSVTFTSPTITTTESVDSFNDVAGLGSAVLAYGSDPSSPSGASIAIQSGSIATEGVGAPAAFASGAGSSVVLTGTSVTMAGPGALQSGGQYKAAGEEFGSARGGRMTLNQVTASAGQYSGPVFFTSDGNSSITVNGGSYTSQATMVRLDGNSSMIFTNATLVTESGVELDGALANASSGQTSSLSFTGGSFTYNSYSPLFSIFDGKTATISLNGMAIQISKSLFAPVFLSAGGLSSVPPGPGPTTTPGANVTLTTSNQSFVGNVTADTPSSVTMSLTNDSQWSGNFVGVDGQRGSYSLTLDTTSTWSVTANCALDTINDSAGISGLTIANITGNGFTVTYNAAKNSGLTGKTYSLQGGGSLKPAS